MAKSMSRGGLPRLVAAAVLAVKARAENATEIPRLQYFADDLREAFVIGDLHADAHCAREWVRRSGLVDLDTWAWRGEPGTALVFLGDYVDKGPEGRQVLEFVRSLTEMFPQRVLAMLGNHDFYFLLDAVLGEEGASSVMGSPVRDYAYAFTHPEEYLNWLPEEVRSANETHAVLEAVFQALAWVYERDGEAQVMLAPTHGRADLFEVAPPFREDRALAQRARARLREWRWHVLEGLTKTGLAAWLAARPVAAQVGGALVVHGGLPAEYLRRLLPAGDGGLGAALAGALRGVLQRPEAIRHGDLIDEAVTYRGYHSKKARSGCAEVEDVLSLLKGEGGPELIIVGHTPGNTVRVACDGRLVAADSSLSRFFRAYGNRYCPVGVDAGSLPPRSGCAALRSGARCSGQALRLRLADAEAGAGAGAPRWQVEKVPMARDPDAPDGHSDAPDLPDDPDLPAAAWLAMPIGALLVLVPCLASHSAPRPPHGPGDKHD